MTSPLDRAMALIAIVVDGDPEDASRQEERRTAAVTACRVIHENKLLQPGRLDPRLAFERIHNEAHAPGMHVTYSSQAEDADAQARRQAETDPNIPHCDYCRQRIKWNEQVIFRLGSPMVHVTCYPKWKLTVPRNMW